MLEPIVGALYERLVTIVPEGPRCDRAFLEGEAVPPLVRQYLLSLLDREAEDRLTDIVRLDENWFDVGASSVQTALKSLRRAAVAAAGFPSADWDNILRQAARSVVTHIVRPIHAATAAAFRDGQSLLAVGEIRERLRFFTAYDYLAEAADGHLKKAATSEMERSELEDVIRQADAEVSKDWSGEEWVDVLGSFRDLVSGSGDESGLPVRLLSAFFADKGRDDIVSRLVRYESEVGQEWISADDLGRLIDGTLLTRSLKKTAVELEAAADVADAAPPVEPEPVPAGPAGRETPPTSEKSKESGPEPLWKRYQRHLTEPIGPAAVPQQSVQRPQQPASPAREEILIEEPSQQPLWQRFRSATGPTEEDRALASEVEERVLGDAIGQRGEFIRDLFGGSEDRYVLALTVLDDASDWTQASHFIADQIFRKHRINIYSSAAVQFTNAVEARFRETNPAS